MEHLIKIITRHDPRSHLLMCGFFPLLIICTLISTSLQQDIFAETAIRYAKNFTIETHDGYKIVTVKHAFEGAGDTHYRYVLYPRETERPHVDNVKAYVAVPIRRAIALSTTFLGPIDAVGAVDSLIGVGSFDYVNTESVLQRINNGDIVEVGSESTKNIELMVALDPEVIFTNIVGSPDYDINPVLDELGITSAITAAYMENTILGRAEWIKYVGAFYNKEATADQVFNAIESRYLELKRKVAAVKPRPTVFANAPWGSVWYVPSGDSYIANLINDAGGDYLWQDIHKEGSQPLDFESVYERALNADVWLNSGYLDTMSAIESQDERYLEFKAVKEGQVYSETLRLSPKGGNDIWERGFIHPEEILSDIILMLHPEVLPGESFVYYKVVR